MRNWQTIVRKGLGCDCLKHSPRPLQSLRLCLFGCSLSAGTKRRNYGMISYRDPCTKAKNFEKSKIKHHTYLADVHTPRTSPTRIFRRRTVVWIEVCQRAGCTIGKAWQRWEGRTQRHVGEK